MKESHIHLAKALAKASCELNFLHAAGIDGFRRICDHHRGALPIEPAEKYVA